MKKALQTMVLFGAAAGLAHAETSVTLYGLVDAGIGYSQAKVSQGNTFTEVRSVGLIESVKNGNRWGLKGNEDLGNGTSAIFQLENGFSLVDGSAAQGGRLFGRKAIIGLHGADWGTLTAGNQYNIADDVISSIDPFGTGFGQAGVTDGAFGDSVSSRMSNSIKYMSPNASGFSFGVAYAGVNKKVRTERGNSNDTSNWISLGLGYDNGPLAMGASYDRFRSSVKGIGEQSQKETTHMWNVAAGYDFDAVKLHLAYGQIRGGVSNDEVVVNGANGTGLNKVLFKQFAPAGYTGKGFRQQAWMAGLSAPVSEFGKVIFSYQGNTSKNHGEGFNGIKSRLNIFSLGYTQDISKRTSAYAIASYGAGKLKLGENTQNAKLKATYIGLGMQHRF